MEWSIFFGHALSVIHLMKAFSRIYVFYWNTHCFVTKLFDNPTYQKNDTVQDFFEDMYWITVITETFIIIIIMSLYRANILHFGLKNHTEY